MRLKLFSHVLLANSIAALGTRMLYCACFHTGNLDPRFLRLFGQRMTAQGYMKYLGGILWDNSISAI